MKHATERDWLAATRGNGTADREDFERWALSLPGAPSRRDPRVWEYLIVMAEEMESVERGAYGQPQRGRHGDWDDLADEVAGQVVADFRSGDYELNARRRKRAVGSSAPVFRSYLSRNGHSSRLPPMPPPPAAVQSLRSRDRARYGDERPFDPEERVEFGAKPHHFAYPNPSLSEWRSGVSEIARQGVRGVSDVFRGKIEPYRMTSARARDILYRAMRHERSTTTNEEIDYVQSVAEELGVSWYEALSHIAELSPNPQLPPARPQLPPRRR